MGYASGRENLPLLDARFFGGATARSESAGTNGAIRTTPSRSCWPKRRTRFGRGISRSLTWPRQVDLYYLYVILDIFSATWLAGCFTEKVPRSPNASSPRAVASRTLSTRPAHPSRGPWQLDEERPWVCSWLTSELPRPTPGLTSRNDNLLRVSVQDDEVPFPSRFGSAEDGRLCCGFFDSLQSPPALGMAL